MYGVPEPIMARNTHATKRHLNLAVYALAHLKHASVDLVASLVSAHAVCSVDSY